jgi:poly-gamma-glutamate capsule biosynthesis protein CapA/YwtB (metallophosphatase superfamily)
MLTDHSLELLAVGDLMLTCPPDAAAPVSDRLRDVADLLGGADITLGNLECTLPGNGEAVHTEPRVITTPDRIRPLASLGFDVVSLANNHVFDALHGGFAQLRELLDDLNVASFGAGDDLPQARHAPVVERTGIRVAFLGAADERSGTPFFASDNGWGIAPWDVPALAEQIGRLRNEVDHVVVCPHWGEERLLIPSPQQIADARAIIDAGASLVIGHHPHVVQGVERYRDGLIAYSLGNCIAGYAGFSDGDAIEWNRTERTGLMLRIRLSSDAILDVESIPIFDDGSAVRVETTGAGETHLRRVNRRLTRGVTPGRYRREHLRVKTLIPLLQHLRWRELKRLRWRNIRNACARLVAAGRAR